MNCELHTAASLSRSSPAVLAFLRDKLTKPGSDFHHKLTSWIDGAAPTKWDGHIAVVLDHGEIVGWARTEYWTSSQGNTYDTLEAFVAPEYRLRGVAAYAAAAIYAGALHDSGGTVAVFHPHMLLVAKRAGLWPTLFERRDGRWEMA